MEVKGKRFEVLFSPVEAFVLCEEYKRHEAELRERWCVSSLADFVRFAAMHGLDCSAPLYAPIAEGGE